jgi:hypothetical protein
LEEELKLICYLLMSIVLVELAIELEITLQFVY